MFRSRFAVACLVLSLSAALAQAEGLFYQLPKDGSWATYEVDSSFQASLQSGKVKGTLRIASVGQETVQNQPCRWIEVQFDMTFLKGEKEGDKQEETNTDIYKLLIPEKYLIKGESPLMYVVRAWIKHGDAEPGKMKKPNNIQDGPLPLIFSEPWKDLKQLDKVEVESKLGKLECEGVKGTLDFDTEKEGIMRCKVESRLHPKSPFGSVTSRWSLKAPENSPVQGTMEWKLKLVDFGENATSNMPEQAN